MMFVAGFHLWAFFTPFGVEGLVKHGLFVCENIKLILCPSLAPHRNGSQRGGMAQWVKCMSYRHEDLCLNPQNPEFGSLEPT